MSRCRHLTSPSRGWALPLVLVVLVSCGGEDQEPVERPSDRGVSYEAQTSTLPDFRDYVVGELSAPTAGSRDPFRDDADAPALSKRVTRPRAATPVEFQLHGIVERQGERVALFRRRSVRVGEKIAGWTVREIEPRQVILERDGRTRRLNL